MAEESTEQEVTIEFSSLQHLLGGQGLVYLQENEGIDVLQTVEVGDEPTDVTTLFSEHGEIDVEPNEIDVVPNTEENEDKTVDVLDGIPFQQQNKEKRKVDDNSSVESDSEKSDTIPILTPLRKRNKSKSGQFKKKGTGTPEQLKIRERNRIDSLLSRKRRVIFQKLQELENTTKWTGFVVLKSNDEVPKYIYGGTSPDMINKFVQGKAIVEDVAASKNKQVNMSTILDQLSKSKKISGIIPESPGVSPSKLPSCMQEGSFSANQRNELQNLQISVMDAAEQTGPTVLLGKRAKKNIFQREANKTGSSKRGRGRGSKAKK